MSAAKYLIVNADDFGWSQEVNEGILKAHCEGIVTSVSLMTTMPGFEDALQKIKENPNLDVGIHLDATRGAARQSFDHQIQQVLNRGVRISHLDTEKHIHCLPSIFEIVLELAEKYRIRAIRFPWERLRLSSLGNPIQFLKVFFMSLFAKKNKRLLGKSSVKSPDFLLGIALSKRFSLETLQKELQTLPEGVTELSCHPGLTPKNPSAYIDAYREKELEVLTHPDLRNYLYAKGFQLIRFADLV